MCVCVYLNNILVISNSRSFPQIGIRTQRIENGWNGSFHWETHEIEGPPDWIRLVLTSPSSQLLLPSHANLWLYADMFVFLRQSKKLTVRPWRKTISGERRAITCKQLPKLKTKDVLTLNIRQSCWWTTNPCFGEQLKTTWTQRKHMFKMTRTFYCL